MVSERWRSTNILCFSNDSLREMEPTSVCFHIMTIGLSFAKRQHASVFDVCHDTNRCKIWKQWPQFVERRNVQYKSFRCHHPHKFVLKFSVLAFSVSPLKFLLHILCSKARYFMPEIPRTRMRRREAVTRQRGNADDGRKQSWHSTFDVGSTSVCPLRTDAISPALHPSRGPAVLHPLLRVQVLQPMCRMRPSYRHRQQGSIAEIIPTNFSK